MVAFSHHRHLRALDAADITLPGNRLVGLARVRWIVVVHFADEHRRLVDHGHAEPFAPRITGGDHDVDRLVEPPRRVGQQRRKPCFRRGKHRRSPAACRRRRSVIGNGRHDEFRLLLSREAGDFARYHQLPPADQRGDPVDHSDRPLLTADLRTARHGP